MIVALHALPAGEVRRRYERELLAELYGAPVSRQFRYAAGTLIAAWSLREAATGNSTMRGTMIVVTRRKPLLCALNLHHHYVRQSTEDGSLFWVCRTCGKDRPENHGGGGGYIGASAAQGF